MLKFWYFCLRLFYYPFLVWVLPLFSKKVRSRLKFERKNDAAASRSFKKESIIADYAFEISSEGELEQVRVIIEKLLKEEKKIELIYCSDSVEKQCETLVEKFPSLIRTLRLPLISFLPFGERYVGNWLTAKNLFLCRYDFFPELIFYGRKKNINLILLSGTMKNYARKINNPFARWYYHYVYNSFDKVVMSTSLDKELVLKEFEISDYNIEIYDFRPIQIYKRIRNKHDHLSKNFPCFESFLAYINHFDKNKRIILGSYWNDEKILTPQISDLIKDGFQITIVPHKLDEQNIELLKENLNRLAPSLEIYEISQHKSKGQIENTIKNMQITNGILILNLKGILCELYTLYGHAYVAGGFRLSVHSLMEPYLGEGMIYCGPKIHRSTEYDLIRQSNPDRIRIVEYEKQFISTLLETDINSLSSMSSFKSHYEGHFAPLLNWLGIPIHLGGVDA